MCKSHKENEYGKPICQYCNKNVAHNSGRRPDRSIIYRKAVDEKTGESKYICDSCRRHKYKKKCEANGTIPGGWAYGAEHRRYKHVCADYCENKDGRLGFKCTADIRITWQLDVDHMLENNSTDDPNKNSFDNLQTLCKNCHSMKNYYVAMKDVDRLFIMLKTAYSKKKLNMSDDLVYNHVDLLLDNAKYKTSESDYD